MLWCLKRVCLLYKSIPRHFYAAFGYAGVHQSRILESPRLISQATQPLSQTFDGSIRCQRAGRNPTTPLVHRRRRLYFVAVIKAEHGDGTSLER